MFKSSHMGWSYHDGAQSYREGEFTSVEEAIHFCRTHGYGYIVEHARGRYHPKKSYSDNFKWPGNPKEEDEEY